MSPSFIVATILVAGWNVVLTVAAFLTETGPFRSTDRAKRQMESYCEPIRAEVGKPDLDARTEAWKRESAGATAAFVSSRVTDSRKRVTVHGAYADASVTVATDDGPEQRRCTVNVN